MLVSSVSLLLITTRLVNGEDQCIKGSIGKQKVICVEGFQV